MTHKARRATEPETWFDYTHQAWVKHGRYVRCGHYTTPCTCYGRIHEGERVEISYLRNMLAIMGMADYLSD